MYTSGCPKNQNKCWYKIGSPPPVGSKKEVLKFRSEINIVIAPAKTGKDRINKVDVTTIDQMNSGVLYILIPLVRILIKVVMKLIDLKIDEIPPKCKEKIAKSTDRSLWYKIDDNGG